MRQHRGGKIPEGWAWWGHPRVTASFGRGDLPISWECVCVCVCSAANLRLALFNPMDRSLPGSSCPWDFPGGNTGVSCHFLLQGIVPTLGSNLSLLHRQAGSLPPSHLGSPYQLAMVTMTRYGVLTPIGPFMRYETCVSDNFVHCTEHSVPPGFICERICIRQGPN